MKRRMSLWLAVALLCYEVVVAPPALATHDLCMHTHDPELCGACEPLGYRWCEMCDKCLLAQHAVFKDEL